MTGWFSEFGELCNSVEGTSVVYGEGPTRRAGSTYDPTSHYRAARVFGFFEEQQLTPELLREASRHQVGLLAAQFDALDLNPAVLTRDRGFRSSRSRDSWRCRARRRARSRSGS